MATTVLDARFEQAWQKGGMCDTLAETLNGSQSAAIDAYCMVGHVTADIVFKSVITAMAKSRNLFEDHPDSNGDPVFQKGVLDNFPAILSAWMRLQKTPASMAYLSELG